MSVPKCKESIPLKIEIEGPAEVSPVTITLAITPTQSAFSLSGQRQTEYRNTRALVAGAENGLVQALIRSLEMITQRQVANLLTPKKRRPPLFEVQPERGVKMLSLTLRTSNPELIERAVILRETTYLVEIEAIAVLRHQLRRFNTRWELLPVSAPELKALRLWAGRPARQTDQRTSAKDRLGVSAYCEQ